nr:UbiD family decarboxylase domain-containing protein [Paraburkholderia sp. BL8N3]
MSKINNLRDWLEFLDRTKRLICLEGNIALEYDVLRYIEHFEGKQACFFSRPGGHDVPIAGGLLGQRQWVAELLELPVDQILPAFQRALKAPLEWNVVEQDSAAVHEVTHDKDIDFKKDPAHHYLPRTRWRPLHHQRPRAWTESGNRQAKTSR